MRGLKETRGEHYFPRNPPPLPLSLSPYKGPYEHRGALRGTPGSAYPRPEPNATELPRSALGGPELVELQASAPSPTPTRAEEQIASAPSPAAAT